MTRFSRRSAARRLAAATLLSLGATLRPGRGRAGADRTGRADRPRPASAARGGPAAGGARSSSRWSSPAGRSSCHPNLQRARDALALLRLYGRPVGTLPLIGAAAGFADAVGVAALAAIARRRVRALGPAGRAAARPAGAGTAADSARRAPTRGSSAPTGSGGVGGTGRGVTVALLDSGVAPDPDLTQPTSRLLAAVGFAGSRGALPDPGGHGTHVAGIVAGNGTRSAGQYVGVAPEAGLVDVRVLDGTGRGRVSSVVRGIGWVLANRARYNIRVLNLSFGAPASGSYRLDPLAAAAEIAWRRGLVVVVAAGNGGPNGGTVESPAVDPYVIAVGASDDQGTVAADDDRLAWFSAWGTRRRLAAAPGPGRARPAHRLAARAGELPRRALPRPGRVGRQRRELLPADRHLDGDAGRGRRGRAAAAAPAGPAAGPGQGAADRDRARLRRRRGAARPTRPPTAAGCSTPTRPPRVRPAGWRTAGCGRPTGFARAVYPVLYGRPLLWRNPTYLGINWAALTWATLNWAETAWGNLTWDAVGWDDAAWDDAAWDDAAWDDAAWDDAAWDDAAWDDAALRSPVDLQPSRADREAPSGTG